MAPVGTVDLMGELRTLVGSSSSEVGVISLFILLILSIALIAMCVRCHRKSGNAYDVSGSATDGAGGANGAAGATKGGGDTAYTNWRSHHNMPASTLERSMGSSN